MAKGLGGFLLPAFVEGSLVFLVVVFLGSIIASVFQSVPALTGVLIALVAGVAAFGVRLIADLAGWTRKLVAMA